MSDKEVLQDHMIEDLKADVTLNRRGLIASWVAFFGFFQWYDSKAKDERKHHEDHPQYHANGFSRVVDNFVSKDHFNDVVAQLNKRIEELERRDG